MPVCAESGPGARRAVTTGISALRDARPRGVPGFGERRAISRSWLFATAYERAVRVGGTRRALPPAQRGERNDTHALLHLLPHRIPSGGSDLGAGPPRRAGGPARARARRLPRLRGAGGGADRRFSRDPVRAHRRGHGGAEPPRVPGTRRPALSLNGRGRLAGGLASRVSRRRQDPLLLPPARARPARALERAVGDAASPPDGRRGRALAAALGDHAAAPLALAQLARADVRLGPLGGGGRAVREHLVQVPPRPPRPGAPRPARRARRRQRIAGPGGAEIQHGLALPRGGPVGLEGLTGRSATARATRAARRA